VIKPIVLLAVSDIMLTLAMLRSSLKTVAYKCYVRPVLEYSYMCNIIVFTVQVGTNL